MKSDSTIAPAPLKQIAQAFLKQIGLYQRLRSSCVFAYLLKSLLMENLITSPIIVKA